MKKFLISTLIMMMFFAFGQFAYATTPEELPEQLYAMGAPYGMTEGDKVKIQRYITQYGLTDEQSNAIMAKANEALAIVKQCGTENIPAEKKNQLKNLAIEAADIVGAKIVFASNKSAEIYVDGVKFDTVYLQNVAPTSNQASSNSSATESKSGSKLVYTGNNYNVLIFSTIALIALGSAIVIKKKIVHAE